MTVMLDHTQTSAPAHPLHPKSNWKLTLQVLALLCPCLQRSRKLLLCDLLPQTHHVHGVWVARHDGKTLVVVTV